MLKIQVWMRGTNEYSRHTIPGPTPDQTQEEFEEAYRESGECFCEGDTWELCPYFNFEKRDSIDVYLGGDDNIKNDEKPVYVTSNWEDFEFVKGGGVNYIPQEPDEVGKVNIWWYHDMKFNDVYYWTNVTEFDPSKLQVQYGVDQDGNKYLEDLIYDGEHPDDFNDFGDSGYGYTGPEFIYHPDQKFAEKNEE